MRRWTAVCKLCANLEIAANLVVSESTLYHLFGSLVKMFYLLCLIHTKTLWICLSTHQMLWLSKVSTGDRQRALLLFQTVWLHLKSSLSLCVSSSRLSTLTTSSSRFWTTWTLTTRTRRGSEPASSRSSWRRWPSLPKDQWVSYRSKLVRLLDQKKKQNIIHMFCYLLDSSTEN